MVIFLESSEMMEFVELSGGNVRRSGPVAGRCRRKVVVVLMSIVPGDPPVDEQVDHRGAPTPRNTDLHHSKNLHFGGVS